jgi:hypothetical protein
MSQRPAFRDIAPPLDVDDGALKKLADHMNVPVLRTPEARPAVHRQETPQDAPTPEPASPPPKAKDPPAAKKTAIAPAPRRTGIESLTIELPAYLIDAIKRDALDHRSSARYVVMLALQKAGFKIDEADLVPDGRRVPRKSGNP